MKTTTATVFATAASLVGAQQAAYGQCGGQGWAGATTCTSGFACSVVNPYYSQCLPGTASTTLATTTRGTTNPTGTAPAPGSKVRFAGVNIAGFDFGCGTDGTCNTTSTYPPLSVLGGNDGAGQMNHFVKDDNFNTFRLPVGWQWLVNNKLGGTLDATNFGKYNQLMQACLATGATCIIDIHNYARWNGKIIGQGGPTNDQFASLWSQLAAKYANNNKIMFGLMNEPHDVPNIQTWAQSAQAAVTAIRKAGATTNMILLPGNNYASAAAFVTNGSGAALAKVTNLDGSTTNLIFDVHKYSDVDNSGTHTECTTDNISDAYQPLATWLRSVKRQAINTETGGGNTQSCIQLICRQLDFLNANSDVFLGWVSWSAGNFAPSYELNEVPTFSNGRWTDTPLVAQCFAPKFK